MATSYPQNFAAVFPADEFFDVVEGVKENSELQVPGVQIGSMLGRGSTARVWQATDDQGRAVAVKVFESNEETHQRAFDEAGALARVVHPNIIKIHAVHRLLAGSIAVIMDRCATTLAGLIETTGPLRGAQVVGLLQGICRGLSALHRAGLVHGDISPSNIGLSLDGIPQLLDFGGSRDRRTLGTPGFSQRLDAQRNKPADVENRMRRLLGGAQEHGISLPGGLERARDDVLGALRVGIYALGAGSKDAGSRGSVVATVAETLNAFAAQVEAGTVEARPEKLAAAVSAVIPPAPISIPWDFESDVGEPFLTAVTRRADESVGGKGGQVGNGGAGGLVGNGRNGGAGTDGSAGGDELWAAPSELISVRAGEDHTAAVRDVAGKSKRAANPRPTRAVREAGKPNKRPVLLAAAVILGLAALGGGVALGVADNAPSTQVEAGKEDFESKPRNDVARWQERITDLGRKRDAAIVAGDAEQFLEVNAPSAPAAQADTELLKLLAQNDVQIAAFATQT
ncbi:MAG TPA: protein kinase, partial [Actinomycetales bacterium]|nr:protein kinase [Actinomycetales bacterium]